jgi:hypothetical protein
MCMICIDLDKNVMTCQQGISNLLEMKELIGKEHTITACVRIVTKGISDCQSKPGFKIDKKYFDMLSEIMAWCSDKRTKGGSLIAECDEGKLCV